MTEEMALSSGVEVLMSVTQSHRRELLQTLEDLKESMASGPSRGVCDVLEDAVVPNRFVWAEWWPSDEDVEMSMRSDRFATLMAAIQLLGSVEETRRLNKRVGPGISRAPNETTN